MKPLSIIVPTWNNQQFLDPCVTSIMKTGILDSMADLIIVNNGKQDIERTFGGVPGIRILNPGANLGWEGGLELGVKESSSPFVVFQNDDTFVPPTSSRIYQRMLSFFQDDNIAAVGPTTTVAAGMHSIYSPACPILPTEASFLIFFMVMVRRAYYDAVGGIDTLLPGGDDLDLSMRFRKAGYKIVVDPGSFIIHHGFKTGERVKGDSTTKGGWNSQDMTDRTNAYLIRKHGFKDWWKMRSGLVYSDGPAATDLEGNLIRQFVNGATNIVELGCGATKTIPSAIGVDRIPSGQPIPHLHGAVSVADIVADVSDPLPIENGSQDAIIARHILEHCIDPVATIFGWKDLLKMHGRLVVAVPDEKITKSIPLNPEHCHAFTMESMENLMEVCGLKLVGNQSSNNGVSFVGCYERIS